MEGWECGCECECGCVWVCVCVCVCVRVRCEEMGGVGCGRDRRGERGERR